jgi:hypothetical protein
MHPPTMDHGGRRCPTAAIYLMGARLHLPYRSISQLLAWHSDLGAPEYCSKIGCERWKLAGRK